MQPRHDDVLAALRQERQIEIDRWLGAGGFSSVYAGRLPGGTPCAVRVSNQPITGGNGKADKELEALVLARQQAVRNHRGIVSLLPQELQPPVPFRGYLVTLWELCDEGNLLDRLHECQKQGLHGIPAAEALGYVQDIAEALDHYQRLGIVHRDVKPENMLRTRGYVKLADPSLLKHIGDSTASHTGIGSAPYMPYESLVGNAGEQTKTDPTIDVFGLAATYVMLRTGHHRRQ